MGERKTFTVNLDSEVMERVDEIILKNKYSNKHEFKNRSDFIEGALIYYLKINLGISYFFKKK